MLPFDKIFVFLLSYSFFLILIITTQTKLLGETFHHSMCNPLYWTAVVFHAIIQIIIAMINGRMVIKQFTVRKEIGYHFCRFDINYNWKVVTKMFLYSLLIGITAGSLGVGGGVILGPLLLEIGVEPIVSTHTTNFMVVFSSSATLLQFYLQDLLVIDYGIFVVMMTFVSAFIGVKVMRYIINKIKKEYPLVVTLAFVLITSSVMLLIFGFNKVYLKKNKIEIFRLGDIC